MKKNMTNKTSGTNVDYTFVELQEKLRAHGIEAHTSWQGDVSFIHINGREYSYMNDGEGYCIEVECGCEAIGLLEGVLSRYEIMDSIAKERFDSAVNTLKSKYGIEAEFVDQSDVNNGYWLFIKGNIFDKINNGDGMSISVDDYEEAANNLLGVEYSMMAMNE